MTEEFQVWTVSEFIELVNDVFARQVFPGGTAVEGEVAEYRVSQNRWIWFRLKDGDSTIECFSTKWQLRTPLEDGMRVRVFAKPKIHPRSGKFSLTVDRAEPLGEGALRRAFELLKAKLEKEGVFGLERKRELPDFPRRIGLVASRESAAYSDFLRILGSRWGGVEINAFHVQVQGQDAVSDIARAFRYFNEQPDLADVIVLTRGGGSLEDLQAFNSEEVVRAVFSSRIPVVCAVGHERDESLADYAADVRASTPTHAAELVVPDRGEIESSVLGYRRQLLTEFRSKLRDSRSRVARQVSRLDSRLEVVLSEVRGKLRDFDRVSRTMTRSVRESRDDLTDFRRRLERMMDGRLRGYSERLGQASKLLAAVDPKRPLERGYALLTGEDGKLTRSIHDLRVGQVFAAEMKDGRIQAEVTSINEK